MKKCILALLLVFAFSVPAFAKSYINGIDANYPPFAYIDEKSGNPAGFDVESMDWIANTMGFTIKHMPIEWDAIIPTLLAKKIDMVCSGMTITPERATQVAFSKPYWKVYNVFVTKKESDLTVAALLTQKLKLGGQRGTNEAEKLDKDQKEKNLRYEVRLYDSAPLMIEDVLNGRIDAALMDSLPALDSISKGKPVKIAGTHGDPVLFGVAFRKDDTELQKLVNEGYKKLMADPFWKQLQQKYDVKPLE
ncbi:MAG: ABC transporter substrate-binding protein [Betaproteobacteria bacterium]|nr:ABC transporter substrate-binding protein [Betaproteobacteria bacterium]